MSMGAPWAGPLCIACKNYSAIHAIFIWFGRCCCNIASKDSKNSKNSKDSKDSKGKDSKDNKDRCRYRYRYRYRHGRLR